MTSARRTAGHVSASQDGFTLLELMVTVAVVGLVLAVTYPTFNQSVRKARTTAYTEEITNLLVLAKQEAVRRAVPVVVQPDPSARRLFAYANVDGDPAITYQPDDSKAPRTVDYEVFRHEADALAKIQFVSPPKNKGKGGGSASPAVDGLTSISSGENAIVFEPNGSVRDIGALRVADEFGNYFEVRVGPAATGRITVLKYNADPSWGDPPGFFPRGIDPASGDTYWVWSRRKL